MLFFNDLKVENFCFLADSSSATVRLYLCQTFFAANVFTFSIALYRTSNLERRDSWKVYPLVRSSPLKKYCFWRSATEGLSLSLHYIWIFQYLNKHSDCVVECWTEGQLSNVSLPFIPVITTLCSERFFDKEANIVNFGPGRWGLSTFWTNIN